jgi:OmcA/MtrC family decaheme c-type cytochrome
MVVSDAASAHTTVALEDDMETAESLMRPGTNMRRPLSGVLSGLATVLAVLAFASVARADQGDCGQPVSSGAEPSVVDCHFVLRAAVKLHGCTPSCICDTTGDGATSVNDALLCLRSVVGDTPLDQCRCVEFPGGPPIQESCVVCHGDGRFFDVAVTHPGLQTLPQIQASIDSVTVDVDDAAKTAQMTVHFTATDAKGGYIHGLGAANIRPDRFDYLRFAVSQLMPPATLSGDPDTWVSYTIGDRNPANLVDHGDGTYTYVLATNLYGLYIPTNRHRLLLIVSGDIVEEPKNVTFDFVPEQLPGPFSFDLSRDIVTTTACNECHGRLDSPLSHASFHGNSRYEAEACATCHTTTLADGAAELTTMTHKIHSAQNIEGLADFSEVTYSQDLRNCDKCHAGLDGSNWNERPSMTACGSCHTEVDFTTGAGHLGGIQLSNANCSLCHSPADIEVNHRTETATPHNPEVPDGLVNFEYVVESVTVNANNQAVVTFHINKDGEPLNLSTIPPAGFSGGPSFLVAYALPQDGLAAPADYNQLGRSAAQPATVSLSSLAGTLTGTPDSYTAVLSAAPFPVGASLRAVALQGYFTQLANPNDQYSQDSNRVTPSVITAVTGDDVRRHVVDVPKCLNCHESLQAHGGNRVDNAQVCVVCHNPNLSSSGRTADASLTAPAEKEKLAAAGHDPDDALTWPEATQSFKNLIHGIHASGMRESPFEFVRNRQNGLYYNWSEVTFPGILSDCDTCHLPGTYDAELPPAALVSTDVTTDGINLNTAGLVAARNTVPNPTDLVSSTTAGTCAMCHDGLPAGYHMQQSGGVLRGWRAEALGDD